MQGRRAHSIVWALSVGVVLADSSIVTLALPEILREYDASVFGVSWVLTVFNIFLASAVLPAARLARRHPAAIWASGLAVFAGASLLAGLSPSITGLIAARAVQAIGGAAVIAGAIELLARGQGSHAAAAPIWGGAGTAGLALGPAVGGLLTEALSWEAIFLLQVPLLLGAVLARSPGPAKETGPEGSLDLRPEAALALISAGLTAALFLLVILLTEGWGLSPIEAALVISVIPLATLLSSRLPAAGTASWSIAIAGGISIAGGLAALGVLPGASPELTMPPQVLIGAGVALVLPALTGAALGTYDPRGSRAAATIAARHWGIVAGIVLLTPLLSLQLDSQHEAGRDATTALLLDAPLSPETKLEIASAIGEVIDQADGRLPPLDAAFAQIDPAPEQANALAELEAGIDDQLERAATHAFSLPFLGAASFALMALIPIGLMSRGRRR